MRIVSRDDFIRYLQKQEWATKYDYTRGLRMYIDGRGTVLATGRYSNSGQDPEYILMDPVAQKQEPVKAAEAPKTKGKK